MRQRANPDRDPPPASAKASWFADFRFTRHGLIVKKTGRRIGRAEITPAEACRFCLYFAAVLVKGWHVRLTRPSGLSVWFAPDRPGPWYVLWSAMTLSGVRFARTPEAANAAFYFEDITTGEPPRCAGLVQLNSGCGDISKSRVADVFAEVSGYTLKLDPETYHGAAVEKSESNGLHDGRIIVCPCLRVEGKSYQRLVDCSDGHTALDFRTTIIGRAPRFVVVKSKPAANRFSMHNDTARFHELAEVFSAEETGLITRFAEAMQLDWAALDILRDRDTGRIYVVDVNKTDTGPAVDLPWRDRARLMRAISRPFLAMIAGASRPVMTGTAANAAHIAAEPARTGQTLENPRQG